MSMTLKSARHWLAAAVTTASFTMAAHAATARDLGEAERNRALIVGGMDAWAAGTGSPYDLLAEDARWTITGTSLVAKTYPSKEAFLSEVIRPFNARMRDRLIPTVHRTYADGDTVVVHFDAAGRRSTVSPT